MGSPYRIRFLVPFHLTDAAGIMHFSSYFLFMEQAEHALLRHLGTSVVVREGEATVSWPRVSASCDWSGSACFEDDLDVDVSMARLGQSSVTYEFDFHCRGKQIATGRMTAVCCRIVPGQRPQPIAIPEDLRAQLTAYEKSQPDR